MADLQLRQLHKTYDGGVHVVRGIDLDIRDGEFIVFVGPSGCGKTTTLRMLAGLEDISAGELRIGGKLVNDVPAAQRGVAMVFQSYALYPHMTVAQNMSFSLRLAGASAAQIEAAISKAARVLQLEPLLDRKPKALSGGQRQRVAIGRAIVRDPAVFLFDEPLSNLDAALRVQMRAELASLHQQLGTTMVYVTHDQVEAMTLGQRIVVFNAGRIEQVGTPLALYEQPANRFVAGFIGSPAMNFLPLGPAAGSAGLCGPGFTAEWHPPAATEVGLRPEHIQLVAPSAGMAARVARVELLGGEQLVHLRVDSLPDQPVVTVKLGPDEPQARVNDLLGLQCAPDRLHFFDPQGSRLPALQTA